MKNREIIEANSTKAVLEPAYDRYISIYKLLTTLPGSPTDFAGDKVGATGYETKSKNYHQQNRNTIHWEWLNDPNYKFIQSANEKLVEIAQLRKNPELSALNNGAAVAIPLLDGSDNRNDFMQGVLRYNEEGSVVLTLHNSSGSASSLEKKMTRKQMSTSTKQNSISNRIVFDTKNTNAKQGLKHGIEKGTIFKNADPDDSADYVVDTMKIAGDNKEYYYFRRHTHNVLTHSL